MIWLDFEDFKVGELVTRDGTDVHRVIKRDPGDNCMTVRCIQAPSTPWCKVGEEEYNLCRRYSYVSIDGEARRVSDAPALPLPSQVNGRETPPSTGT